MWFIQLLTFAIYLYTLVHVYKMYQMAYSAEFSKKIITIGEVVFSGQEPSQELKRYNTEFRVYSKVRRSVKTKKKMFIFNIFCC